MGRDKALLPFGGYATLAEYQYRRLLPLFSSVYLSAKDDKFPFDAPLIFDREEIFAPTAGLLAAFDALDGDFFVLGVDTPFVEADVFDAIVEAYRKEEADAYIARSPSGSHPACGIYTRRLIPALQSMVREGNHRLHYLLKVCETRFVDFDDDGPFYNINRPDEYERALAL